MVLPGLYSVLHKSDLFFFFPLVYFVNTATGLMLKLIGFSLCLDAQDGFENNKIKTKEVTPVRV